MKKNKAAGTATVGEKGQIVIPKNIRDMFGIVPGDTLFILADAKKGIAIPTKDKMETIYRLIDEEEEKDE